MSEEKKTLLVCGSRGWGHVALYLEGAAREARVAEAARERDFLPVALDEMDDRFGLFTRVIHGDAKGADKFGGAWATARGKEVIAVPADWDEYGKAAGPLRNQKMLDLYHPDMVIAFLGNQGTRDMLDRSLKQGVPIVIQFRTGKKGSNTWDAMRLTLSGQ